jgi:hypothetical protein
MQAVPGGHTAFDINLDNVLPATSVAEANSSFSARAGAAILYAANTSLPKSDHTTLAHRVARAGV